MLGNLEKVQPFFLHVCVLEKWRKQAEGSGSLPDTASGKGGEE